MNKMISPDPIMTVCVMRVDVYALGSVCDITILSSPMKD